jgi:hypothetical protein
MNTEPMGAVDTVLQGIRATLEADGYELEWSEEDGNQIGIRIIAGAEACADCLVPAELMRGILSDALRPTSYSVGTITLPDTS